MDLLFHLEGRAGYQGEFRGGIIYGVGTFYFSDNRQYQGEWKNNKMHGYGCILWPNGNKFEGEFKEDKKEGFGILYCAVKIFCGMWKNNKLEGDVIIIEDWKKKKQFWVNGKASKKLDINTPIVFEKIIDDLINHKKNKKHKKDN